MGSSSVFRAVLSGFSCWTYSFEAPEPLLSSASAGSFHLVRPALGRSRAAFPAAQSLEGLES